MRLVRLEGFWMDACPVTVRDYALFVEQTGYLTFAETKPNAALVFARPERPAAARLSPDRWWRLADASWRHPDGCDGPAAEDNHPAVQLTRRDAQAYADWAGKALPSEDEWEAAARGGLQGLAYPWGDEFLIQGQHQANTWQGEFPYENLVEDGWDATSPVGSFPPNGYGLFDMVGNVWEWTCNRYVHDRRRNAGCCGPHRPDVVTSAQRWTLKGGSFLCAPNYCLRYRPAARSCADDTTAACHIGFRCVVRPSG